MPDLDSLATRTVNRKGLSDDELAKEVALLGPRWSITEGELRLDLKGPGMTRTCAASAYAGKLADELDHHPRVVIDYHGMVMTLHTHDAKAITAFDLVYAARFEKWLRGNGWPT
jgi:pterin-4a-carbinolamine dehydratase